MKNKYNKLNIILSLITAALMLITAYFMKGHEYQSTVTMLLIAIWFVPFTILSKKSNEEKGSCKTMN